MSIRPELQRKYHEKATKTLKDLRHSRRQLLTNEHRKGGDKTSQELRQIQHQNARKMNHMQHVQHPRNLELVDETKQDIKEKSKRALQEIRHLKPYASTYDKAREEQHRKAAKEAKQKWLKEQGIIFNDEKESGQPSMEELHKQLYSLNPNDEDYQERYRELNTRINKLIDKEDEEFQKVQDAKKRAKENDDKEKSDRKTYPLDGKQVPYYKWYRYAGGHQQDYAHAEKRYRDWRRKEIEYYRDEYNDEWRKQHGYPRKRRWHR